ncbi:MAG: glycosyltransferase family 39 protein [Planctomycetota bacterium]
MPAPRDESSGPREPGRWGSGTPSRALLIAAWGGVLLLALALRLPFVNGLPETPDGVRLIRSLERFDPIDLSPHFPGYPLAVWVARRLPGEGGLPWDLLSALAGSLVVLPAGLLLRRRWGDTGALAAALACALLPFAVLESLRVGTDMAALPLLFAALLLLSWERGSLAGGLLLGLALGLRPSLFPWAAGLLLARERGKGVLGCALGTAIWLLPALMVVGASSYLAEGWRFTAGHFQAWGGAASAPGDDRGLLILKNWLWAPLLGSWSMRGGQILLGTALALGWAAFLHGSRPGRGRLSSPVAAGGAAYLLWIVLAQNPEHPRHALPLVFLLVAAAAAGGVHLLGSLPRPMKLAPAPLFLLALSLLLWGSVQEAGRHRDTVPPALAAARPLAAAPLFDPLLDRVYAGSLRAFFTWVGPGWSIGTAFSAEDAFRDLNSLPLSPRRAWITSHALAAGGVPGSPARIEARAAPGLPLWGDVEEIYLVEEGVPWSW